jgi:cell division transport system permease protein
MSFLSRLAFVLKEGFLQLVRAKGLSTAVIVIVAATLVQLSIFLGITRVLDNVLGSAREKFELAIFLSPGADVSDRNRVLYLLNADPLVASVKVVTKEEAIQEFRKDPEIDRMMQALGENPLTDSISAALKQDAPGKLEDLVDKLKKTPKVEEVNYGKGEWETVSKITQTVRWVGLILGVLIFLAALFIVSNTFALALWAKREYLTQLSRMGAPTWMRWGPFILEGILQGLLGSALVVGLLEIARYAFTASLQPYGGFQALLQLPGGQGPGLYTTLMLLGVILGVLGAFLALQKKWVKDLQ